MQASSPWPDVIVSSQPDLIPEIPSADSRHANDFHVDVPQPSLQHVTNDPFSRSSSNASNTAGNLKLAATASAGTYKEQRSKIGKAAAHE